MIALILCLVFIDNDNIKSSPINSKLEEANYVFYSHLASDMYFKIVRYSIDGDEEGNFDPVLFSRMEKLYDIYTKLDYFHYKKYLEMKRLEKL